MKKSAEEMSLIDAKVGAICHISRCLSPTHVDVYRLLELGLCKGAVIRIMAKSKASGTLLLGLAQSRICIAEELAREFLAI